MWNKVVKQNRKRRGKNSANGKEIEHFEARRIEEELVERDRKKFAERRRRKEKLL